MKKNVRRKFIYLTIIIIIAVILYVSALSAAPINNTYYPAYSDAAKAAKITHSERIIRSKFNEHDLWNRISIELQLPHYTKVHQVQEQINFFKKNKKFFDRSLAQAYPFLFYIYTEVEKRNLPGELILLPMIESAYDPFAHSWVGAAGLWQFMPETATDYGIKQNWWYDGRRDVTRSTKAALSHLNNLSKYFKGNWLHAIAAYNCGAGNVQRAIEANIKNGKSTEFWVLPLPDQTKNYVPRLLALAAIVADPHAYGLNLPPMPAEPYFAEVDVGTQIDLSKAAKMADISLNQLYQLNPGYSRWTTAPDGPHTLLLPVEKVNHFEKNAKHTHGPVKITYLKKPYKSVPKYNAPAKKQPKYEPLIPDDEITTYVVKQGDTLWNIAQTNHVNVADLKQWNHLDQKTSLTVGNKLVIKHAYASAKTSKTPLLSAENATMKPKDAVMQPIITASQEKLIPTLTYQVKKGDTLNNIAKRFSLDVNQIKNANALNSNLLNIGQTLYLPQPKRVDDAMMVANIERNIRYTVKKGDRLAAIADNYHIPLDALLKWNHLNEKSMIHPGQQLQIKLTEVG